MKVWTKRASRTGRGPIVVVVAALLGAGVLASPGIGSAATLPLRTGDNYKLGKDFDPVRGLDAPGLAVDPGNPDHIVEVQLNLPKGQCEYNTSFDGGTTWKGGILLPPPPYPQEGACTVLGHGASAMDASVAFGSGQNVYTTFGSAKGDDGTTAFVAKSTNGGKTFPIVNVAIPGNPGADAADHEYPKLAVVPGGGVGGADKILLVATDTNSAPSDPHIIFGSVVATVSNDSGATWSPRVVVNQPFDAGTNPYAAIEHTQPVIGPDGTFYVAWRTSPLGFASSDPHFADGFLRIGKSTDNGQTWTETNVINVRAFVYTGPVGPPYSGSPQAFCCSSFPRLAIDKASGNLYMVWSQDGDLYNQPGFTAQDHFQIQRSQVWFIRSTDGAATWTDLRKISDSPVGDPPTETQTRHPNVFVAPNGRVDVVWQDRRHSYRACTQTHTPCAEARLGDTYYSYSLDQGVTFSPNRRITDRSMNNDVGYDYRFSTYWNFGPVLAPLGNDKILFAWQDSRLGNFDNDSQDIFLAKTDLGAGNGPLPVKNLGTYNPDVLAVKLSKAATPGGSEAQLTSVFATRESTKVVIANRKDVAGILAGGVLARANLGPLLLGSPSGLTADTRAEVARMSPIGAYILGDTNALGPDVEAQLVAAGVPAGQIVRISVPASTPPSALETQAGIAAQIAMAMDRRSPTDVAAGVPAFDAAVIANPDSPDAEAVSTMAVNRRLPILYVSKGVIPAATNQALAALNINKTYVIGGPGVVSKFVEGKLAAEGRNPVRLGGPDQFATSIDVLKESIALGLPTNQVFVGNGSVPLHPALLGYASGRIGGLLLLTPDGSTQAAQNRLDNLGLSPLVDRLIASNVKTP